MGLLLSATLLLLSPLAHSFGDAAFAFCAFFQRRGFRFCLLRFLSCGLLAFAQSANFMLFILVSLVSLFARSRSSMLFRGLTAILRCSVSLIFRGLRCSFATLGLAALSLLALFRRRCLACFESCMQTGVPAPRVGRRDLQSAEIFQVVSSLSSRFSIHHQRRLFSSMWILALAILVTLLILPSMGRFSMVSRIATNGS
jgi:hypothetical protein